MSEQVDRQNKSYEFIKQRQNTLLTGGSIIADRGLFRASQEFPNLFEGVAIIPTDRDNVDLLISGVFETPKVPLPISLSIVPRWTVTDVYTDENGIDDTGTVTAIDKGQRTFVVDGSGIDNELYQHIADSDEENIHSTVHMMALARRLKMFQETGVFPIADIYQDYPDPQIKRAEAA